MRYIRLFIILIIVFGISVPAANAEDESPSVYETALADMINDARTDRGLAPLSFHSKLYLSASLHSSDMIEKNYYSSTSPDRKTFQERMLESGYIPVVSGESLGMLSFRNFISPDDALMVIFDNILKDESENKRKQPLYLLNPDAKHIGISFRAGTFKRGDIVENVYVVVCDVGNNDTSIIESELIKMINDARKNSRKAFEDLGMDIGDVQKNLGYYSWILDNELSPLTNNEKLREAARNHTEDMIQRFYFDNVSPEGKEPLDRVSEAGYQAVYVNEVLLALGFENFIDPIKTVDILYEMLMKNDCSIVPKSVFDGKAKDVGMNFDIFLVTIGTGNFLKVFVVTIEFGNDTNIFSPVTVEENYHKLYSHQR